jgi:hypothetical protein
MKLLKMLNQWICAVHATAPQHIAPRPLRKMTIMKPLKMLNQWICVAAACSAHMQEPLNEQPLHRLLAINSRMPCRHGASDGMHYDMA